MLLRPSFFFFFFLHFIPSKQNCQHVKCPVQGGGAWGRGIPAMVSRGGEHQGGRGRKHNRPWSDGHPDTETWAEQTNKVKAVKLNDHFYLFACWFVFSPPLPRPQLCASLGSSHLALVFAGHRARVCYICFKVSSRKTDSSRWIPDTFYNQLHDWYWGRKWGTGISSVC